jgi:hypothetical protein
MVGKPAVFLEYIPKALEDGALSGKKLLTNAKEIIPKDKRPLYPKSPFIEALFRLLDKKIIQIDEYKMELDTSRDRKQSFTDSQYGFIFSLVKTEPHEIFILIKELDKTITYKNAKKKLKYLFTKKIDEIELENQNKWEKLKKKLIVRTPNDEELLWYMQTILQMNI